MLLRDVLCFMKHTWIVGIVRHRWLNLFCNHIFIFFLSLVYFWPQLFLELLWLLMAHICIKNCWEGVFIKFLEIIFWYKYVWATFAKSNSWHLMSLKFLEIQICLLRKTWSNPSSWLSSPDQTQSEEKTGLLRRYSAFIHTKDWVRLSFSN